MTALITGGEGDLAAALKLQLDSAGFDVGAPGRSELDVTDESSVSAYFQRHPRIDLLINQAGVTSDAPLIKLTTEQWDKVVDTSLKGAFLCSKAALRPMMKARNGHIINIGSFSALRPPVGQSNYAAAKAGLIGLTQSLAAEVGSRNVRVNCILPGFLETKMTATLSDSVKEKALEDHQLNQFNTPLDVARFVSFLDTMPAVSGQVFQLDSRLRRW